MAKRVSLKGKGADLFFGDYAPAAESSASADERPSHDVILDADATGQATTPEVSAPPAAAHAASSRNGAATVESPPRRTSTSPRKASKPASVLASTHDVVGSEAIEAIRKVVKAPGREVSFVRLTAEEKAQLADIVYTFKRQGQKTTENEVNRIALNYLLHDYREHGESSVLVRVLAALLA